MEVTQHRIAQEVGVSQITVSRALRGHPSVGESLRDRVLQKAKDLGYANSLHNDARRLISRRHGRPARTRIIALATIGRLSLTDLWMLSMVRGIEQGVVEHDLQLLLVRVGHDSFPENLRPGEVDGVIIPGPTPWHVDQARQMGLPLVGMLSETKGWFVRPSDVMAGYLATQHLLSLGHRRIAFLGQIPENFCSQWRIQGYRMGLNEAGLTPENNLVQEEVSTFQPQVVISCFKSLWEKAGPFSAMVVYNDLMALYVLQACESLGLAVPALLSLVSIDDLPYAETARVPLTTVRIPLEEMGREAVRLLLEQRDHPDTGPRGVVLPVTLVERASCRKIEADRPETPP